MTTRLFCTPVLVLLLLLMPLHTVAATTLPDIDAESAPATPLLSAPPPQEQAELRRLVIQDCGSCHGLRMTGGLGPALTPDALGQAPRSSLIATVLYGRPGTAMPPWRDLLTQTQAEWIIDRLLEGLSTP